MTIQEAIKSDLPFKRKCYSSWIQEYRDPIGFKFRFIRTNEVVVFNSEDLLADDWIIQDSLVRCPLGCLEKHEKLQVGSFSIIGCPKLRDEDWKLVYDPR